MHSALLLSNPAITPVRRERLRRTVCELKQRGLRVTEQIVAGGLPTRQAVGRLATGHQVIIAAGGDGTVNAVAAGLMDLPDRPPLAILPLGTANDIARQFGVVSLPLAVAALSGVATRTDVIEIQPEPAKPTEYALNFAAFGFATDLLRATTPRAKRWLGRRLCYWLGFIIALVRHRPPVLAVCGQSVEFSGPVFHVAAGNLEGAGGGLMRLSPGACPTDGQIELCVVEALRPWRVLQCVPQLMRGTHPLLPEVRYERCAEFVVRCSDPLPLAVDGDIITEGSARFRVRPGAIQVLRPAGADHTARPA